MPTTYADLQAVALKAVGLKSDALSAEDAALIAQAPNDAVTLVTLKRRWPRLRCAYELSLESGTNWCLLPEDFSGWDRDGGLAHAPGLGYGQLRWLDAAETYRLESVAQVSGVPMCVANGPVATSGTGDGRRTLRFYPTPDAAYTLYGVYRRQPRAMSAAADQPDLELELHPAARVATQLTARELFNQEIPADWEARLERLVEEAWRLLGTNLQNAAPLRDVNPGGHEDVPRGVRRELSDDYDPRA